MKKTKVTLLKVVPLLLLFIIPLIPAQQAQAYFIQKHTMCRDVDSLSGVYLDETHSFLTTDEIAYVWVYYRNVFSPMQVEFFWYDPDGALYDSWVYNIPVSTDYYVNDWIWIDGEYPATKPGQWRVEAFVDGVIQDFIDYFTISSGGGDGGTFTVTFNCNVAPMTIDGTTYSTNQLPQIFNWEEDSTHTVSVESSITSGNTKYIFQSWSPDSSTSTSRIITVTGAASYVANYQTQYKLNIVSNYGTASGQGWYDSGDTAYATISANRVGGFIQDMVFTGWSGDASGTGLQSNAITMDGPKTATANWTQEFNLTLYLIVIAIIVVILVVVYMFMIRRKKSVPTPPPPTTATT